MYAWCMCMYMDCACQCMAAGATGHWVSSSYQIPSFSLESGSLTDLIGGIKWGMGVTPGSCGVSCVER